MMQSEIRKKNQKITIRTVLVNEIEVVYHGFIVGYGLAYYDGRDMLKPDIVSLTGDYLPEETYLLRFIDEPKLAVMAKTVQ
jgi:hypothetical protein